MFEKDCLVVRQVFKIFPDFFSIVDGFVLGSGVRGWTVTTVYFMFKECGGKSREGCGWRTERGIITAGCAGFSGAHVVCSVHLRRWHCVLHIAISRRASLP